MKKRTPLVLALLIGGCAVGPDYQRPTAPTALQYKEAKGWHQARPQDQLSKGDWWAVYHDSTLDSLLRQVKISNQNVAQYEALYRQALALASESRSDLLPTATGTGSSTRSGASATTSTSGQSVSNSHALQASASWELDIWGKMRRTLEENRASAEASAAELANMTLSAQSTLAQNYFQLRILDQRIALYQKSVDAYQRYLTVIQNKYQAGSESRGTLAQAETQLESARASALDLSWQRAQLEHAIAVLMGKTPAEFSLAVAPLQATLPAAPVTLPADLLQRRPDIAQAERTVAAANAAVGVAIAGYYPDLTLSASAGYSGSSFSHLLTLPNRVWSLGPSLSGTLLDFGATSAKVDQARAAYDADVASYRQTVLSGFEEVENYLVALRTFEAEMQAQQRAAASAQESARVTNNQYQAGMIDYLDVATTENTSLTQQQSLLTLQSTQWVTSVQLIVATGGGWKTQ
ncbi:efflux transporter outer membrane subunit [Pantoea agglomerans]|uniref:Efflux transporter outer membrane subunit n=1 Tax=Enterobacter agglomerans TaxID=549 RepID=A0ACC5RQI3_ENTAG|nr:efflux transporter outer membrane subunit [Pantoea agglomerans]MBK4726848.1 efflux transporter outer membrane subunit [Pantoea agglomerans]